MNASNLLKRYWWAGLIVMLLVAGISLGVILMSREQPEIPAASATSGTAGTTASASSGEEAGERPRVLMTAQDDTATGIGLKTIFHLSFPKTAEGNPVQNIGLDNLAKNIQVQPRFGFKLQAEGDGAQLIPDETLAAGQLYRFTLDHPDANLHESWAFQTRRDFRVVSTLPAERGTGVPPDTGIEIRFSDPGFSGCEALFSLVPILPEGDGEAVKGQWQIHKDTAVFIPSQNLIQGTLYRGTLKAGVTLAGSPQEIQTETVFTFQTQLEVPSTQVRYMNLIDFNANASSIQTPYYAVSCDDDTLKSEWEVTVWQYPEADAFQHALAPELAIPYWADRNTRHLPDTTSLKKIQSFRTSLHSDDSSTMLIFPDLLPEGHYLISCLADGQTAYGFLQVNDLMLYLNITESGTLGWANDLASGQALSGVALKSAGASRGVTGNDGTVLLPGLPYGKGDSVPAFLQASRDGHPTFVAVLSAPSIYDYYGNETGDRTQKNAYWNYLYTERSTYLPTDTVSFWGVLRPRDPGFIPGNLTMKLEKNAYWWSDEQSSELVLETQSVILGDRGTFEGQFVLENLEPGNYRITLRDGDTELGQRYIDIFRYVKPAFQVTGSIRNKILLPGEKAEALISGRFFEGTPVPGLLLDSSFYYGGRDLDAITLMLDEKGEALASATIPDITTPISWQPQAGWFHAGAQNPEEAEISLYETFTVFPRDTMAWMESSMDSGTFTVDIHVNRINPDAAKSNVDASWQPMPETASYKGQTADVPVHGVVYEHYWDHRTIGKGYDFVNKVSYDQYEYFEVNRQVAVFDGTTVQGLLRQTMTIPGYQPDREYRVELGFADSLGRPVVETRYLTSWYGWYGGYGGSDYYQLETEGHPDGYRMNETVRLNLLKNGKQAETAETGSTNETGTADETGSMDEAGTTDETGTADEAQAMPATNAGIRILYMQMREGHIAHSVTEQTSHEFLFDPAFLPNLMGVAVVFDGKKLTETDACTVRYAVSERQLKVETFPDASSYRPGQTASVRVHVTDAVGNPVEASINLAIVDEAYFALYGQTAEPLQSLYSPVFQTGTLHTYLSHRLYDQEDANAPGAEGGEGDDMGSPVRKDFKDTAWFGSTSTDATGDGWISFQLPDNVTTFRITSQAVTEDLKAGAGTTPLLSTLPFFLRIVAPEACLEGDAPILLLRGYGTGMKERETRFTVTLLTEDGMTVTKEASATGSEYAAIPLEPLTAGKVTLTMKGMNGTFSDSVERILRVEKNLLTIQHTSFLPVKSGMKLESTGSPAILTISNRKYAVLQRTLWNLYGSYGNRVDKRLARQLAAGYLKDVLADPYLDEVPDEDFSLWQGDDGGIALLPYDSTDTLLTAKVCSVAREKFDTEQLRRYFTDISKDQTALPMDAAAARWGLASLGEPVLLDLRALVAETDLKDDERMIYALALADLGDLATAASVYDSLAAAYGKQGLPYRWFDFGRDKDDTLQMTAYAAMLAQKIGHADRDALYAYLQNNGTDERPVLLEQLALLDSLPDRISREVSATLVMDGKRMPFALEGSETFQILVKPELLASLQFEDIAGDMEMAVVSRGSAAKLDNGSNKVVSISRKYLVNGLETSDIGPLDLVEVVLSLEFDKSSPEGGYELSDLLPAGLRFTYGGGQSKDWQSWIWWQPDGRIIRTTLYHKGGSTTKSLHYWARVSGAGSFSADAAVLKSENSDACGFSEVSRITVQAP